MATREQCEQRLRQMSKGQYMTFIRKFGGGIQTNTSWKTEAEFLDNNIRHFLRRATDKGLLDELGIQLGFPSDAESNRLQSQWAIRRSWIALVISIVAAIGSVVATIVSIVALYAVESS